MDIYIQYWEAVLDNITDEYIRAKIEQEVKDRKSGLKNDTKCSLLGPKCNWPYCVIEKRLTKGYCSP